MQGPGKKWEHYELTANGKPVRQSMHVKAGDVVQVITGADKGKVGKISKVCLSTRARWGRGRSSQGERPMRVSQSRQRSLVSHVFAGSKHLKEAPAVGQRDSMESSTVGALQRPRGLAAARRQGSPTAQSIIAIRCKWDWRDFIVASSGRPRCVSIPRPEWECGSSHGRQRSSCMPRQI